MIVIIIVRVKYTDAQYLHWGAISTLSNSYIALSKTNSGVSADWSPENSGCYNIFVFVTKFGPDGKPADPF